MSQTGATKTDPSPQAILDGLEARAQRRETPCGDGAMAWRAWGDPAAPPVVLLHGGSGSWSHWVLTLPALEGAFHVLAADLPGNGDSADPPPSHDGPSLAGIVSAGIDGVLPGDAPFDLVGFSFGGVISGLVAHRQARRIRSLTIVGSPILGLTSTGPANRLVPAPPGLPRDARAALYRGNLQKLMVRDPEAVDELAMTLHMANMEKSRLGSRRIARTSLLQDSLHGLPCELGCIFGEHDVTLYPDIAGIRAFVEGLQPGLRFAVVPGAGHWVQYEAPEAFNALLPEFLGPRAGFIPMPA